jgi:hypothetical protein
MVGELAGLVDGAVTGGHAALAELHDVDTVSHDVVVNVLDGLEKYRWILQAHAV